MATDNSQIPAEQQAASERLDFEEFADHFQQCYQKLWVLAVAVLGDRHQAEDMVQEAATVALRRLEDFEPGTNFVAWMARIVRLQALNSSRKRRRRKTHSVRPEILDSHPGSDPTSGSSLEPGSDLSPNQTHFDDDVVQALLELSEVARACLLLKTVHHLSYGDICDMLDIAEGTAMSHVYRSKAALRQRLAGRFTTAQNDLTKP